MDETRECLVNGLDYYEFLKSYYNSKLDKVEHKLQLILNLIDKKELNENHVLYEAYVRTVTYPDFKDVEFDCEYAIGYYTYLIEQYTKKISLTDKTIMALHNHFKNQIKSSKMV